MAERFRVTYATLSADNEDLQSAYDEGLKVARSWFGASIPAYVKGEARTAGETTSVYSPVHASLELCKVHTTTPADFAEAMTAAKTAAPRWAATPWQERVVIMRRVADLISQRSNGFAALMSMEVGKNRLEALGDVEESADLIRYYCDSMEKNDGFVATMGTLNPSERNLSVLRPYGVWGVISPFNFPMALSAGPSGGALAAGNAVVLKPSLQGSFTAAKLYECMRDGGVPGGVFQVLTGGDDVGKALVDDPATDGMTFTGSHEVGMSIYRKFVTDYPKPVVCEMGGKNPAIVSAKADLDIAAAGVARSAFGFTGQKCSACSRVYVQREACGPFLAKLAERAAAIEIGDPTGRTVYMGPVISDDTVQLFAKAVAHAREVGRVVAGGNVLRGKEGLPDGHYVEPTIVTDLPEDDYLLTDELFMPVVAVVPVDSMAEALAKSNASELGLTAGFYSADQAEIDEFLAGIEAGVVYVNRAAGATTGAWPGVQPFGGWKGSGSSGKAGGGLYYVQQFMREQSRSVVVL